MNFDLTLIRHGKTMANEKKLYCGITDLSLSAKGIKEIKKQLNMYPPCEAYFTSGMKRADETLKLIYGNQVEFEPIRGLREINLGHYDLKSYEELQNSPRYIKWITDKTGNIGPPGGETKNQFYNRVILAFLGLTNKVIQQNVKSALCICHGGVIASIIEQVFVPNLDFYTLQPKPGEGYTLHHSVAGYTGFTRGLFKK